MLYAVSALLTALICGPLFGDHLLYRDAVATARFPLVAAAFGIDGAPPRAVPQDAFLALTSRLVDGGWLVASLTALAMFAAGVGYGRLALRLVPSAGRAGATAAATVGIWNPFVAERLLQGHWSLLAGYAALGWVVPAVLDLTRAPTRRRWAALAGIFAAGGLTPTGSVLVVIVAAVVAAAARLPRRRVAVAVLCWLATASPWLVGAALATGTGSSGSAAVFALRAEPWLGTVGTAPGLGGIWNADAVPASRQGPWALVATACLLLIVAVGTRRLLRHGTRPATVERAVVRALAGLAVVVVVLVIAAATPPGPVLVEALLRDVPGAGLFRDTQKYLAPAVPFAALAAAGAVDAFRRSVPAGFAAAAVVALIVAPLPDLAWGVGGKIAPVVYPGDYAQVTALIGDDADGASGAVAVWPADAVRRLSWTAGPSLTPLPRLLDAPVVVSGELTVDGRTVDGPTGRTAEIVEALRAGGDPRILAESGVGWVVVEEADPPPMLAASGPPVMRGPHLSVWRIDGARPFPQPSVAAWAMSVTAHMLWLGALLGGIGALLGAGTTSIRARFAPWSPRRHAGAPPPR